MSKIDDLLAEEGEAAEHVPTPEDGTRRNHNRSEVFSVRLSPEEADELGRRADELGIPVRTLVRSWILQRMNEEADQTDSLNRRVTRLEEAILGGS